MYRFKNNKYTTWYFAIIGNANERKVNNGYTENHHIIPKSLGGVNSKDNLVKLTGREHFIVHLLLIKMVKDIDIISMVQAVVRFSHKVENSRQYELLRSYIARYSRGKYNHAYGKMWVYHRKTSEISFIDSNNFDDTIHIRGLPYQRGGTAGNKWINDGKEETLISSSRDIPTGWCAGRIFVPSKAQIVNINAARHTKEKDATHSKSLTGRIQIYNEALNQSKRIQPERQEEYFQNGWIVKSVPTKKSTPVKIDDIKYETLASASTALGICQATVSVRVKSQSLQWKNWVYV